VSDLSTGKTADAASAGAPGLIRLFVVGLAITAAYTRQDFNGIVTERAATLGSRLIHIQGLTPQDEKEQHLPLAWGVKMQSVDRRGRALPLISLCGFLRGSS
jgi:hypothetical protein